MKNYLLPGKSLLCKVMTAAFLFLTTALYYGQLEKTYISSQSNQIYGFCALCAVVNPQNVVGSNETDYATIRIPVGILGRIEQNFKFSALTPKRRKIVIGIETPNVSIKKQAERIIYIETFNGNTSNGDSQRLDSSMLKPGSNPEKGTIEFISLKQFDRVRITVNSGLIGLGEEIRIYYMYHLPAPFTTCGNPPLEPMAYYSFDGNTNDIISDYNLTGGGVYFIPNDMACGDAVYAGHKSDTLSNNVPISANTEIKTIAFWVKMDDTLPRFTIRTGWLIIKAEKAGPHNNYFYYVTVQIYNPNTNTVGTPIIYSRIKPNELAHFTLKYDYDDVEDLDKICLYKNGIESSCYEMSSMNKPSEKINLSLRYTKIDELLLYDRVLTEDEIKTLVCSYGVLSNCPSATNGITTKNIKAIPSEEVLTVSPNPTTGQITLDGNILFLDADISITNTSGKEVFRSKFISKTFELPSRLPGGVYILNLQTKDKKMYSRKIILNR